MAKRPSLVGSARAALDAAAGETPAEPVSQAEASESRSALRRRVNPTAEATPVPTESMPEATSAGSESVAPEESRLRGPTALVREFMAFGGERLRRAIALGQVLGQCRSPAEAFAAQAEFARETVAHYAAESYQLMHLAGAGWTGCWGGISVFTGKARPR